MLTTEAAVKKSEAKARSRSMRFRRSVSSLVTPEGIAAYNDTEKQELCPIILKNADENGKKNNHRSTNFPRVMRGGAFHKAPMTKYFFVAMLGLGSLLELYLKTYSSGAFAERPIPVSTQPISQQEEIGGVRPTRPSFVQDSESQFGDKMVQAPLDIISQNNSGKESEIVHLHHYARSTLTGRYLYNCQEGGIEGKNLCNAQFAFADLSDHVTREEAVDQSMFARIGEPLDTSLQLSFPTYPSQNEYAVLSRRGYKGGPVEHQINQDRPFILHQKNVGDGFIMGIWDGHGLLGHSVAHFALMELIRAKMSEGESQAGNEASEWNDLFKKIEAQLPNDFSRDGGSTASIVAKLGDEKIIVANTGDSRSIIVAYERTTGKESASAASNVKLLYQTRQDKADQPEEKARIEAGPNSGFVLMPQEVMGTMVSSRVQVAVPEMNGFVSLAMSRSFGDQYAKRVGVIVDPTVGVLRISELKKSYLDESGRSGASDASVQMFAISLSDGLFDYIDIQEIAETLATSFETQVDGALYKACEGLIMQSSRQWMSFSQKIGQSYRDDISIAVQKI